MEELSTGIGKRIKTLRMIQHMNQEQLAEELDITVKHMSEVERGKSLLSLEKLVYLADILDCDMNYLIIGKVYRDFSVQLPDSIIQILETPKSHETDLLLAYLEMYTHLRT